MGSLSRIRITHQHFHVLSRRHFSSILSPDSTTPLTTKQKTRAALSLLKTEKNPQRILDICLAASLTPDLHLDRIAFSLAVSSLTQSNSFDTVRSLLEALKSRPDLRTDRFLSHSIVLYGQARMLDHALRTFNNQFDELSIPRSVKSLNALLFACILCKNYSEVNRIFLEFPKVYGIKPNLDTYNTVIKAFCESGMSNSVYSVVAEMDRKGIEPNATSFGTWLAGFYREEKYEDVGKVLEMMAERGMRPGVSTYNIRIQSLCKLGKSGEAKSLLEGMVSRRMKPNSETYYNLIYGFCKEGNLEEAKKLFFYDMMRKGCSPSSNCYFTLVYYLCQGGDFDTALKVCKASIEKDWIPNFSTMKVLVDGLAKSSKVEEARELVGRMKEKFVKNADMWKEIEQGLPQ